jgi:hypothetical protein
VSDHIHAEVGEVFICVRPWPVSHAGRSVDCSSRFPRGSRLTILEKRAGWIRNKKQGETGAYQRYVIQCGKYQFEAVYNALNTSRIINEELVIPPPPVKVGDVIQVSAARLNIPGNGRNYPQGTKLLIEAIEPNDLFGRCFLLSYWGKQRSWATQFDLSNDVIQILNLEAET